MENASTEIDVRSADMPKVVYKETAKIIKAITDKGPKGAPALLKGFIEQLFHQVSGEDLAAYSYDDLFKISESLYEFSSKRKVGASKIRIYNPKTEENGWTSHYTIIEMVNDDMPFIIDSVSSALNRLGYQVYLLIHPVLSIKRDTKGEIKGLLPYNSKGEEVKRESVVHIQITYLSDKKYHKLLESMLHEVLTKTRFAVEDWKHMLKQLDREILELSYLPEKIEKSEVEEVEAFLMWARDNNFTFLGSVEYEFVDEKGQDCLRILPGSELGVYRYKDATSEPVGLQALPPEVLHFVKNEELIEITKSNRLSQVHRNVYMDVIGIKRFDQQGNVVGEHRFLGLFTSRVYFQSASLIPLIRKKIQKVISKAGFASEGHSGKEVVAVLEAFPRDELLQISVDDLYETCVGIIALEIRPRIRLFVRKDRFERFMSCIIFVPRDRVSTSLQNEFETILTKAFSGTVANRYTQISDSKMARLQIIVKTDPGAIPKYDINSLEAKLVEAAFSWNDSLHDELVARMDESVGDSLYRKYANAFPAGYKNKFAPKCGFYDIEPIEQALKEKKTVFNLYESSDDDKKIVHLKIFNPDQQLVLSDIMPKLENMGLRAIDSQSFPVNFDDAGRAIWVHHYRLTLGEGNKQPLVQIKQKFEEALFRIWSGEADDDAYNKLILIAGFNYREVMLIRAYARYLRQIRFHYSQELIELALAKYPEVSRLIRDLFVQRFELNGKEPKAAKTSDKSASIQKSIEEELQRVTNIAEDIILRRFVALVKATLRTNYYQVAESGGPKDYISFKVRSEMVPDMPLPKPYAEIFVYSSRVEGIHLRGGKVARGGIRWSDRPEDFRTEILGLVKAQMVKNVVIVPVGSKGGFVVKKPPVGGTREQALAEGIACYKTFLSGLLDLTDNIVSGNVVHPKQVTRYDDDDPYLVVAADKGTATFSDIANAVSEHYGFWLGDAFASGGSAGYDHKKMGITARGGWVSVERHFHEMGKNIAQEDFTTVGIGDMAGDVFGNGMLLSNHIKLLAAFNHIHIFIDPNPNAAISFEERKRLFEKPRSSWMDYDPKLISKGGGIFERSSKLIKLSSEAQEALDFHRAECTPDELIRAILLAPAELMWNGGIGTYVKSKTETNEQVGDKANDAFRVNGSELRCKVVGEGGNLGCTQLGRIEYARAGGRINTDAMDNSAGVDCSDHEVNIKIAMTAIAENHNMSLEARNKFLADMTDDVGMLVLRDNYLQTQAVTIAMSQGPTSLELHDRFMTRLEQSSLLNRSIEFLPDSEAVTKLRSEGKMSLTRPELCVLLAYSKLNLYTEILDSHVPDSTYFNGEFLDYFPSLLRKKYTAELMNHQLKREIIATIITNDFVNRMGSSFYNQVVEDTSLKACDTARAYVAARDIYQLPKIWDELEKLDGKVSVDELSNIHWELRNLLERVIFWLLRNYTQPLDIEAVVNQYKDGVQQLVDCLENILAPVAKNAFDARCTRYVDAGIPKALASHIAKLVALPSACDIVKAAQAGKEAPGLVGEIYFLLGTKLHIGWLRSQMNNLPLGNYWERLSLKTIIGDLYIQQMRLTSSVLAHCKKQQSAAIALNAWWNEYVKELERYERFIVDIQSQSKLDFPVLLIAVKRVESLAAIG
ncbi:MAG: NAD-glutamate dehydrogenase [Alphaproteobacteria bacterium]|nr:NAD-glutamate dehydrogenase [Alphaproteobacteria bacterium]